MKTFPTLYKKSETGAIVKWDIGVAEHSDGYSVIVTSWGQEGGAVQETRDVVREGKNLGKKNETSPHEQAVAEAQSKWEKQQKARKYVQSRGAALSGERDEEFVAGGIDPMLAFPIEKKPKAVKYPADVQPKLDGHRCIAVIKGGKATLWSRTRKPINSMPHIVAALEKVFPAADIVLDGELYNHDYHDSFEELTSLIRASSPEPGHEKVQYHIYDVAMEGTTWATRREVIESSLFAAKLPLVQVETRTVKSEPEMRAAFDDFLGRNYEGAILRNHAGLYVGKRSSDLLKVKEFVDAEFECIGVTYEARTVVDSAGTRQVEYPVFKCQTAEGKTFNTPMMGKLDIVRYLAPKMVGKKLTVKFQDLTADGVPRFPKAREYVTL